MHQPEMNSEPTPLPAHEVADVRESRRLIDRPAQYRDFLLSSDVSRQEIVFCQPPTQVRVTTYKRHERISLLLCFHFQETFDACDTSYFFSLSFDSSLFLCAFDGPAQGYSSP